GRVGIADLQRIGSGAADERVADGVQLAQDDGVIAVAGVDIIGAASRRDVVVTSVAIEIVVDARASDRVGAAEQGALQGRDVDGLNPVEEVASGDRGARPDVGRGGAAAAEPDMGQAGYRAGRGEISIERAEARSRERE